MKETQIVSKSDFFLGEAGLESDGAAVDYYGN